MTKRYWNKGFWMGGYFILVDEADTYNIYLRQPNGDLILKHSDQADGRGDAIYGAFKWINKNS